MHQERKSTVRINLLFDIFVRWGYYKNTYYRNKPSAKMVSLYLSLLFLFTIINPAQLVSPECKGQYNTNPIIRDAPTFVSSVPNGKRYVVGSGYNTIHIAHVYGGTPYDMGYAFGKMMAKELNDVIPIYFKYLEQQVEKILKIVPKVIRTM